MLFLHPVVLALTALRCFLLTALEPAHHLPALAGLAAADLTARATHFVTYVALGRSGLQLPVGAYIQPPRPIATSELVLYVAPAVVARWDSTVRANLVESASKAVTVVGRFVSRTFRIARSQTTGYARILAPSRSRLTLLSEQVPALQWDQHRSWRNESYGRLRSPVPFSPHAGSLASRPLRSSPTLLILHFMHAQSDVEPGTGQLGDRTSDLVVAPHPSSLALFRPQLSHTISIEPPVAHESLADLLGCAVGFPVPDEPSYIIIYVRPCLFVGLPMILCFGYLSYWCLRLACRLVAWLGGLVRTWVCAPCFALIRRSVRPLHAVLRLLRTVKDTLANICGMLWNLTASGRAMYSASAEPDVPTTPLDATQNEGTEPVSAVQRRRSKRKAKKGGSRLAGPEVTVTPGNDSHSTSKPVSQPVSTPTSISTSSTTTTCGGLPATPSTSANQSPVVDRYAGDDGGGWTLVTRKKNKARRQWRRTEGGKWLWA
ncbi:hypothetical protein FRC12_012470 [Ceratobasidium sp. 428]|nr:hypothetical protein FRC12_012470 [Ceratobasidium sp. 428]